MSKYREYHEGDLRITELERGERYSVRVRMPPDESHEKWWYSKSRKVKAKNKAEAVKAGLAYKDELLRANSTGTDIDITVGQYARAWQESRKVQQLVQQRTLERDEYEIQRIEHYLGSVKLRDCTADHIIRAYDRMAADGASVSQRSKTHTKLKQVLKRAVVAGTIIRNPAEGIEGMSRPKVSQHKRDEQRVDEDGLRRLFSILENEPQEGKRVGMWLGAVTGMRRGEVLALTWRDINLDDGTITVSWQYGTEGELKDTKTERSVRIISLCAVEDIATDPTIAYLKRWQQEQKAYFDEYARKGAEKGDKRAAKVVWGPRTPVVSNTRCSWQGPDNFGRWRRNWFVEHDFAYYEHEESYIDAAGKRRIRRTGYHGPTFHSLRHTQATVLIGAGADVKAVQDRLGHAEASTTLNIYAEAMRSKERTTASLMSQLVSSAKSDNSAAKSEGSDEQS